MSKKEPDNQFEYEGCDLEAMLLAKNYYQWVCDIIRPYLGKRIVEGGAGVGSFSKILAATKPDQLTLIEPAKSMFDLLKPAAKEAIKTPTKLTLYNGYLSDVQAKIKAAKADTFVYINVFEHIEHDLMELKQIEQTLDKNGHVVIFVPALQQLYSEFDKSIDHYRRYSKESLRKLCEKAGLEVVELRYLDMIGIIPWWISFVKLKRTKLMPNMVKIYDAFCVPIIRAVESIVKVPYGKNVLVVARKK